MSDFKPGDRVNLIHDCWTFHKDKPTVRHDERVTVTEVHSVTLGTRYRGVRCDGTPIEWVE